MEKPAWWDSRDINELLKNSYTTSQKTFERVLSSSIPALDAILPNGFLSGRLIEFVGDTGSGKTQWALTLSSQVLINEESIAKDTIVIYVYTKSFFPIERFSGILWHLMRKKTSQASPNRNPSSIMQRLMLCHVAEQKELWTFISVELPLLIKRVELLVIDSIGDLFRVPYSHVEQERLQEFHNRAHWLMRLAKVLNRLAFEHNFFCILVNHVSDDTYQRKIVPALGLTWSNCINTRCYLEKSKCAKRTVLGHRIVKLLSCSYAPLVEVCFRIDSQLGITECTSCILSSP